MQGRVNATQLEFCLSVYGSSLKRSLTELPVNVRVQKGHLKRSDCDKWPGKSEYSPDESTSSVTSNPGGLSSWILA